ncbi:hypothetical protein DFH06DRAFT_1347484 [Mycena polygramma]|nr:hypothetical protein DFH06DRAFT_1347484 [Mycena polygramma]
MPRESQPPPYDAVDTSITPRQYQYESPTRSGQTEHWAEASFFSQGVANAHVHSVGQSPRSAKKKKKSSAYVVFFGRNPAAYDKWYGPGGAEEQIRRVCGAIYQGYPNLPRASAAFEYARERSWTGFRDSRPPSPNDTAEIPVLPIPSLPDNAELNAPNPLGGTTNGKWYIVYAGISPGIYRSYLECALNTTSISCASYDAVDTLSEARRLWDDAVEDGFVRVLCHPYAAAV